MRFSHFTALALAAATAGLAACSGETADPAPGAAADAVTLEISDARLVLPPVAGNPAAVYFDVRNTGERNYAIRRADIAGAETSDIHGSMEMNGQMTMSGVGQVLVNAGQSESFKPGGFHVMAFGLDPKLVAGGTTEMTLTVVGGKTKTFPLEIRGAGDDR